VCVESEINGKRVSHLIERAIANPSSAVCCFVCFSSSLLVLTLNKWSRSLVIVVLVLNKMYQKPDRS